MSRTPIIVGVGQLSEPIEGAGYVGLSPVQLAARASQRAFSDAGVARDRAAASVDVVVTTRTFEDSGLMPAKFGAARCFPRAVAKASGLAPRRTLWSAAGGDSPQRLVARCAQELADGRATSVLLAGAEAMSSVRHLLSNGETRDWTDETPAENEDVDEGTQLEGVLSPALLAHGVVTAPLAYGLLENARRASRGQSFEAYSREMGELFAPFTFVAASHPARANEQTQPMTGAALVDTTSEEDRAKNRFIAHPYPLRLVSKDLVNQAAAVWMTTEDEATRLGIPRSKWVYLHGHAEATERDLLERPELGAYPAAVAASRLALERAGRTVDDVACFDFYSCFPIAVSAVAVDGLGLAANDPRGLTLTGGLPYFGGPGNNYSMHAIASAVDRVRASPGAFAFVGANGGFLSKYAVGIYAATPSPWTPMPSDSLQETLDAVPAVRQSTGGSEVEGVIESFTVAYVKGRASAVIGVGRLGDGARFIARSVQSVTLLASEQDALLRRRVRVSWREGVGGFSCPDEVARNT